MRRPVCWTERLEDRVKREVRVSFTGRDTIRWQAKRSDEDHWVYDFPPGESDWDELESAMEARYQRRNVPLKDLDLVRNLRNASKSA
jgi:hypothetical protein